MIPLVENAALDTLWLGLRVRGTGAAHGADRSSEIDLVLTSFEGPGDMFGYVTGTFGQPDVYYDTSDGVDNRDVAKLPADAHTHMSWAFTQPGTYEVGFSGRLRTNREERPLELARGSMIVQVGQDPKAIPELAEREVIHEGHADITADIDANDVHLFADETGGGALTQEVLDFDDVVVWVSPKALQPIPASPSFRFLGRPGSEIHQLPQAVLGAHVHGEIDPHLWLSVPNARAYVEVIRDTLIEQDPGGADHYTKRAGAYLSELDSLDSHVMQQILAIPEGRRHLVTTHDAYAYFAEAYGMHIAGFVTPNPGVEPSVAQRSKLAHTIADLLVPAVFLEPTVARESSVLHQVAEDAGVEICHIYSDSFDSRVTSYAELMRFNADEMRRCLGEG